MVNIISILFAVDFYFQSHVEVLLCTDIVVILYWIICQVIQQDKYIY